MSAEMPKRIQMSRQHPWRAENPDAVIVARPSRWGNPFKVRTTALVVDSTGVIVDFRCQQPLFIRDRSEAVHLYRAAIDGSVRVLGIVYPHIPTRAEIQSLAGRDLACWCPLDQPCHADVLLEMANR